jgi:hypothetical protein
MININPTVGSPQQKKVKKNRGGEKASSSGTYWWGKAWRGVREAPPTAQPCLFFKATSSQSYPQTTFFLGTVNHNRLDGRFEEGEWCQLLNTEEESEEAEGMMPGQSVPEWGTA